VTAQQVQAAGPAEPSEQAGQAKPSVAVRARDVLASEWIKLSSVRSNKLTVLIAAIVTIAGTALVATATTSVPHSPGRRGTAGAGPAFSPLTTSFLAYAEYAVLSVGVLGVLVFTSEYSTGLIRTTFTAVPRRRAVLAAKAVVTGAAALVIGELLAFVLFLLTQAILSGHHRGVSLSHSGVPGAVLGAGTVLAVSALIGLGFGAIIRHVAGAIAAMVALLYLTAVLCLFLPAPWNDRIGKFTPAFAAYQVAALHPRASLFSPAASMLLLVAWPLVILGAAAIVITRRDA
jgi:hypothetical protein